MEQGGFGSGSSREGLVSFKCIREDHRPDSRNFTLTVHERAWAFCPASAPSTDHEWVATGGIPLTVLMRPKGWSASQTSLTNRSSVFETAERMSEQLANAVGLRRLVLELARPNRPLVLDLASGRAPEGEPLAPEVDVVLEDEWGPIGVARISVAARERLTASAALVAQRICQDFATDLRAGLEVL